MCLYKHKRMENEYNLPKFTKDGNLILYGNSFYDKIENKNKDVIRKNEISEDESKNRKLEAEQKVDPSEKQKQFSVLVMKKRNEKGLSQEKLANSCNVKKEIIRGIENNAIKPDNKLHQTLRRVLNI